jgi:hypothetical protein
MTALERLRAALAASTDETAEVISADVNEACKLCSPADKKVADIARQHPRGLHELHTISTADLMHLLDEAE